MQIGSDPSNGMITVSQVLVQLPGPCQIAEAMALIIR